MMMIESILADLKPVPASYIKAARRIAALDDVGLMPVRLALAATSTFDLLPPYLVVEGAARGLRIDPYLAPYNQLEQSLLVADSPLYAHQPDVIAIAPGLAELAPPLAREFLSLSPDAVEGLVRGLVERIEALVQRAREVSSAPIVVFNFGDPERLEAGLADTMLESSQTRAVEQANQRLVEMCAGYGATYVFDYRRVANALGGARWFDRKLRHWSRTSFGMEAHIELARALTRYVRAALVPPCKCLVLDLDNTLWGGVVGEDKLDGIALGDEFPGNVYKEFQQALRSLKGRGFLLAIASKNNPEDAEQVFREHADCVLRLDDFAATQIHWNDKASSIRAIAGELNIGLDAIVFFDDNPVERDWVRSALPEVKVIDVPQDPLGYVPALDNCGWFDQLTISDEDRDRTELYLTQRKREALRTQSSDIESFLSGLEMTARIGFLTSDTRQRVAQLINKTNQFNLTTRRYSEADLDEMVRDGAIVLWMRLEDRFGDNGLIAVAIAVPEDEESWRIDTMLMSCRVLGRKAETVLLSFLVSEVARRGGRRVIGEYVPTAKNSQVAGFYADHGFAARDGEGRFWVSEAQELAAPRFIAVQADPPAASTAP